MTKNEAKTAAAALPAIIEHSDLTWELKDRTPYRSMGVWYVSIVRTMDSGARQKTAYAL